MLSEQLDYWIFQKTEKATLLLKAKRKNKSPVSGLCARHRRPARQHL